MQRNYVNAGGLFCFAGQVSQGFIDDTLDSNLSFQLMASKPGAHDKFVAVEAWRERYMQALSQYGYGIKLDARQSRAVTEEQESVWELVQKVLGQYVSPALLEQGRNSLIQLHDGKTDALELFRANTTSSLADEQGVGSPRSAVALQLAFIDAEPLMTQLFLTFQTSSTASLLPFVQVIDQVSVIGNVEMRVLTTEFDEHRYARFRDIFRDKLGPRRAELIRALAEDLS